MFDFKTIIIGFTLIGLLLYAWRVILIRAEIVKEEKLNKKEALRLNSLKVWEDTGYNDVRMFRPKKKQIYNDSNVVSYFDYSEKRR